MCVDPNKLCGDCYYCKSGIGHFCENMIGIGTGVATSSFGSEGIDIFERDIFAPKSNHSVNVGINLVIDKRIDLDVSTLGFRDRRIKG